jgi:predicted glutamine amidotransferase
MCIIAIKDKGAEFNWSTLRKCWDANPDGAGFAYHLEGRVYISKGFMHFRDFKRAVKAAPISKRTEALLHFRIATHGQIIPNNCHPFPLSPNVPELEALDVITDVAIAHNGIVSGMASSPQLSDTMLFIRDYLAPLGAAHVTDTLLHGIIGQAASSKLAIMSATGISTIGKFEESKGWRYSNDSYLSKETYYKAMGYGALNEFDHVDYGLYSESYDSPYGTTSEATTSDGWCDTCGGFIDMDYYDPLTTNWCETCLEGAKFQLAARIG